jgi:hypothetical protein
MMLQHADSGNGHYAIPSGSAVLGSHTTPAALMCSPQARQQSDSGDQSCSSKLRPFSRL